MIDWCEYIERLAEDFSLHDIRESVGVEYEERRGIHSDDEKRQEG